MKKNLKSYGILWAIGFVIFNLCAFLVPSDIKFTPTFWSGYCYIALAFVLHLGTAYFSFKDGKKEKFFYNISTFAINFITLILSIIISSFTMIVDEVPLWIGLVFCFSFLGISVGATLLAKTTGVIVSDIDEKVKTQTIFIKSLAVDAEGLVSQVKISAIKSEATKVYEAIRYSDPMSSSALSGVEEQIRNEFNAFSEAVKDEDAELASTLSDILLNLLKSRNDKCKLLK